MSDDTVFIRSSSNVIFEMTVPTSDHALELWDEKIARGEHTVVENAVWVERPDGTKYLALPDDSVEEKPARKTARKTVEVIEGDFSEAS